MVRSYSSVHSAVSVCCRPILFLLCSTSSSFFASCIASRHRPFPRHSLVGLVAVTLLCSRPTNSLPHSSKSRRLTQPPLLAHVDNNKLLSKCRYYPKQPALGHSKHPPARIMIHYPKPAKVSRSRPRPQRPSPLGQVQHNRPLSTLDMGVARDPDFWKRFSLAVHQSEDAATPVSSRSTWDVKEEYATGLYAPHDEWWLTCNTETSGYFGSSKRRSEPGAYAWLLRLHSW